MKLANVYGDNLQTSSSWQKLWDGPEDPLQYLRSLIRRALGIGKWVSKSDQGSLLREALDLSDLLHPATFLNALRQQTARYVRVSVMHYFSDKETFAFFILNINMTEKG